MTGPLRIETFGTDDAAGMATFRRLDRPPPYGPSAPPGEGASLLVARRGDTPVARLSFRLARKLKGAPDPTGVVGHYEAEADEAGIALLGEATSCLAELGATLVLGPMDGTTWGRYRLALPTPEAGDPAPFLSEPVNPPSYPTQFEAAGFQPVEHYLSQIVHDLDSLADRAREVEGRLATAGYRIEPMHRDRFTQTLDELYDLSLRAFAGNPYFSPIGRDAFQAMYEPVRAFLDPELLLLARDAEDAVVGFAFSFPDLLEPGGGRPTRVIVKSLAVADAARGAGLGSLLVHETHRRAARRGYQAAIHALMHVENPSHRISKHGGDVYRRYALFGWRP